MEEGSGVASTDWGMPASLPAVCGALPLGGAEWHKLRLHIRRTERAATRVPTGTDADSSGAGSRPSGSGASESAVA